MIISALLLSSIISTITVSAAPTQVGQTVKGNNAAWQGANVMVGSRFTSPSNGVANSISVYISNTGTTSVPVKCAIYKESDKQLLGTTQQVSVPAGYLGWQTFTLTTAQSLTSGASYSIIAWFGAKNCYIYYNSATTTQSWYSTQTYSNFPSGPYNSFPAYGQENNVYSLYLTMNPTTTTTTPTNQVGQTVKGNNAAWQGANVMVGSRFTSPSNGVANSISVYISNTGTTSVPVKCAIYKESDKQLLGTTQQVSVPAGYLGWQTFTLTTAQSLTSGASYSIIAWFGAKNCYIYYNSATTTQSWYSTQTYSNFPSGPYNSFPAYGQENNVYSLYLTMNPTTTTTTPTTTPTTSTGNLGSIPSAWALDWYSNIKLDTSVLYNGNPSIRLEPSVGSENPAREVNPKYVGTWPYCDFKAKPGDHIVFKCWIKIENNGDTNPFSGARIGVDFNSVVNGRRVCLYEITAPTYPNTDTGVRTNYVNWGTIGWVQRTIDFIIPTSTYTYDIYSGQYIPATQTIQVGPWLQVWGPEGPHEKGNAWFAGAEFYINP